MKRKANVLIVSAKLNAKTKAGRKRQFERMLRESETLIKQYTKGKP